MASMLRSSITGTSVAPVANLRTAQDAHGRHAAVPCQPCCSTGLACHLPAQHRRRQDGAHVARAESEDNVKLNTEFGYSRKDVILIGVGLLAFGLALNKVLQLAGVDEFASGNITQLVIVVGLCVGWLSTYVSRVMNKDMTYVKQLQDYEEAVMQKRLEEMPEEELQRIMEESEAQKRQQKQREAQRQQ